MTLAALALAFCATATLVHLATTAIAAVRCRPRRSGRSPLPGSVPAITLLRPVCGVEPFAVETLTAGLTLDYPCYEVVFCVAQADDPVVALVHRLIAAHPQVSARLLVGDDRLSVNPKLNNVVKGWEAARNPWIVMADSNVLLPHDALQRLLGRWKGDTGAVSSLPIGSRPANFWAELETTLLNTHAARFEYASEALGFGFAQGKVMLFCREFIENAGGIRVLGADAAEDAATTKLVRANGRRVRLVDHPFEQPLGMRGFREVWSRQVRWARLRRNSFFWLFLPEALVGSALPALALSFAAAYDGFGIAEGLCAAGLLLILWFAAEAALARCAGWHFTWRSLAALLLRDLLLPALWVAAMVGSEFVWRGTSMRPQRRYDIAAIGVGADPTTETAVQEA
jgi:ceramide glucosyltransferase